MRRRRLSLTGLLSISLAVSAVQAERTVNKMLPEDDFKINHHDIQSAIDAAESGETVLVYPDEYEIRRPVEFDTHRYPRTKNCQVPPDPKSIVLKSIAGPALTTIRMSETPDGPQRSSVFIFDSGEGAESVLEGFTICGGGETDWDHNYEKSGGGGILCICSSSPRIRNCIIRDNGSLHCQRGAGLMYAKGAAPHVSNCRFEGNYAQLDGGAVYGAWETGDAVFEDCEFVENVALRRGGAFFLWENARASVSRCRIVHNYAEDGGGLLCGKSSPAFEDCLIVENQARSRGGGVYCWAQIQQPEPLPTHPVFVHCTISGNAALEGGGLHQQLDPGLESTLLLERCIVWGNAGGCLSRVAPEGSGETFVATSSCLEMPEADLEPLGPTNIAEDPLFCGWGVGPELWVRPSQELSEVLAGFDYRLADGSPCRQTPAGNSIGAHLEPGTARGTPTLTVHLAAGTYSVRHRTLSHGVSLRGEGAESTVLEGTVFGLRAGAGLSDLSVTRGFCGGVLLGQGEDASLTDLVIRGNRVVYATRSHLEDWGGGLYCLKCSPVVSRCRIEANQAGRGGGVCVRGRSPFLQDPPILQDSIISGNFAQNYAGGLCCLEAGDVTLLNCTLAGNRAGEDFNGISVANSVPRFHNNILLGTSPGEIEVVPAWNFVAADPFSGLPWFTTPDLDRAFDFESYALYQHRLREVALPDFLLDQPPDYRLQDGSPAVDAGSSRGRSETDYGGRPRVCGERVDFGAFEYVKRCVGLSVSSEQVCQGKSVEVYVGLSSWFPVHGFSFVVAHDPTILHPVDVGYEGCDAMTGLEHPVEFFAVEELPAGVKCLPDGLAGVSVGCVISFRATALPPSAGQPVPVVRIEYGAEDECRSDETSPLRLLGCASDGVASPATVTIEGESIAPTIQDGEVVCCPEISRPFRRGDANDDSVVNLTDAVAVLLHLAAGGPNLLCREAANVNDDGSLNLTDPVYLLEHLFRSGPPPAAPGTVRCGLDPETSESALGCEAYESCDALHQEPHEEAP